MKKNYIITIIVAIILLSTTYLIINAKSKEKQIDLKINENQINTPAVCPAPFTKTVVTACPSFYEKLELLDQEDFTTIQSTSTADGLDKMDSDKADILVSGRIPLPDEDKYEYQVIGDDNEYYSFLSNEALSINHKDLDSYKLYTDIENLDKLKIDLKIDQEVILVSDVYEEINQGLIITRWSNTDFKKANMVQVFNEDGSRLDKSRIPTIYYKSNCTEIIIEEIKDSLNK